MNELIAAFVATKSTSFSFNELDRLLWLSYRLLTPEEHDQLRYMGFRFNVQKVNTFIGLKEYTEERKILWFWKKLDKFSKPVYKDLYTVNMFAVKPKPTLEVL